jgi:lantibiotic biosynthesis protein
LANSSFGPSVFEPFGFGILRAPALPINVYSSASHWLERLTKLSREDVPSDHVLSSIKDALQIASPDLTDALQRTPAPTFEARRKALRYLIRMSTRPTPFGAFAGVALVRCTKRTTLALLEHPHRLHKRLDIGWLISSIEQLEQERLIQRRLTFVANSAAFIKAGRVHLIDPTVPNSGTSVASATIKATSVVRAALTAARSPINHTDLVQAISNTARAANQEQIENLIEHLLRLGFLTSDLRPSLTVEDPGRYFLDRVDEIVFDDPLNDATKKPLQPQVHPATSDLGDLIDTLQDDPTFHVDLELNTAGREINQRLAEDAAAAAEILIRLSPPNPMPHITSFRQEFVSRYGSDREVSILELLSADFGLGLPATYPDTSRVLPTTPRTSTGSYLAELAAKAIHERLLAIELTARDLKILEPCPLSSESIPESLEIFVSVAASSRAAIDAGDYSIVVGPGVGAREAGRSLGRFAFMLGAESEMQVIASNDESAFTDTIHAELVYVPARAQMGNVAVRPSPYKYQIAIGCNPTVSLENVIPLSELVLGIRRERFCIRWPRHDARVRVTETHMLNQLLAPAACRFLTEVSLDGERCLRGFNWGHLEDLPFLPRLHFGRITLSPARWRITSRTNEAFQSERFVDFVPRLREWRAQMRIPRFVYLADGDNRLLLDLEDLDQVQELFTEVRRLQQGRDIQLQEVIPGPEDAWLESPAGRYFAEFAFPLKRRRSVRTNPPKEGSSPKQRLRSRPLNPSRPQFVGDEWLFAKLYVPPSREADLVRGPIAEFVHELRDNRWIDRWFFVRYADPDRHLRLRFHGSPEILTHAVSPKLAKLAKGLERGDLCSRFVLDTYDREVERYGGMAGLKIAECLFGVDSDAVLEFLNHEPHPQTIADHLDLALLTVDRFVAGFLPDPLHRHVWYESFGKSRQDGELFRSRKAQLLELLSNPSSLAAIENHYLNRGLRTFATRIPEYAFQLRQLQERRELTKTLETTLKSQVHMHCNRLLGLDNSDSEAIILRLLNRAYHPAIASAYSAPERPGERSRNVSEKPL